MKRFLWFVALLAAGSLALWFAVGGDQAQANGAATDPAAQTPVRDDGERGRPVHRQPDGTELQIRGGFVIAPYRTVPAADGNGVDRQPIYELECQDCVPTDDGRHRLDGVRVKLFDRGEHAADLLADHAVVELEVSADNKKSLRENRELELSAAVLQTAPGRSTSIRLEVGRVRALVDEDLIRLHTPDDDEPVLVTTGGARQGTLRGRGLRARMPRSGAGGGGRFDLQILRDPSIELAGIELRADGALNYVEQLATGAALVTVERSVRVELADPKRTGSLSVKGDRLHGWLQRGRRADGDGAGAGEQQALVWTMLRLLGSRAQVRTDDVELDSPRLTVLPGPTGLLARITADGGSSDLRQREGGASFRSSRPIHLVRSRDAIGALHRAFGFPSYALGPLAEFEIVTFEGASSVDAGDGVQLASDRGLHLFRQPSTATAGHFVARGFGDVRIARGDGDERVEATGDSGFVLWRTSRGDDVVLGSDDPRSPQRYTLRRGPLQLRGAGAARLLRTDDDRVQVRLRSAAAAIAGAFGRRGDDVTGTLRAAETLDVVVVDEELESFVATGADTEVEFVDRDRHLLANGRRIEQLTAGSWRLSGDDETPARLRQPPLPDGRTAQLWAPIIDVHRAAGRDAVIDAIASGERSARVEALLHTADRGDPANAPGAGGLGRLDARAERIRLLPFAVGPAALRRHLLGLPAPLADIAAGGLGRPWLLATGDVVADFVDRPGSALHGEGALLASSQGASSLLLVGDVATGAPALMHRTEDGVRTLAAAGPRVRFTRGDEDRIVILTSFPGRNQLVPPRVTFRTATDPDDPLAWMRGECRGEIEVAPDGVLFHGPVTAHSLLPSGVDDPNGMHIEAEQLRMVRQRESGELTRVDAGGGVAVQWRHLWARSERVELDLRWQRCIAEDPNDAVLGLGDGRVYRARRLEANYATYAVRSYDGRFVQEAAQVERR